MHDRIDPWEDVHETLKQFCFRIGEGRVEARKTEVQGREIHFMTLYHPTDPDAMLIVHYDLMHDMIYIRKTRDLFLEGDVDEELPDQLPLVHSFPVQGFEDLNPMRPGRGRSILPYVVDICKNEAIYYYTKTAPATIPGSWDTVTSEKVSLDCHKRLARFFDEKNPIPWTERQNPDGKLPPPGLPGLPE